LGVRKFYELFEFPASLSGIDRLGGRAHPILNRIGNTRNEQRGAAVEQDDIPGRSFFTF
jgi:hypothetical protein